MCPQRAPGSCRQSRLADGLSRLTQGWPSPAVAAARTEADARVAEAEFDLQRERDLKAELRRLVTARERRIEAVQAELRALAAGNPAVLPVLARLGIRPEPGPDARL